MNKAYRSDPPLSPPPKIPLLSSAPMAARRLSNNYRQTELHPPVILLDFSETKYIKNVIFPHDAHLSKYEYSSTDGV